jgi:disulfide bond formation protein DsbB
MLSTRHLLLLLWTGTLVLLGIALYMQYFMGLEPCALCMTQRVFIVAVGLVALIAWLHKPGKAAIGFYCILGALMAIIGGAFSTRHLWLQSLPEDLAPACGPTLSYLLANVPLLEALSVLLRGDGNCAETLWTLFGISIPGWTLVAFTGLFLINAVIFYKTLRH